MKVFFDASVILAGLKSPKGGSGLLLKWSGQGRVEGCISEVVLEEAIKHEAKLGLEKGSVEKKAAKIFKNHIYPAPKGLGLKYQKFVIDVGDAHLLESSKKLKVDYLVSLDKKHVLRLSQTIKDFRIVSPGQLIRILKNQSKLN